MEEFARSDLAGEWGAQETGNGIGVRRTCVGECEVVRIQVKNAEAALRIGKPQGCYVSISCGEIAHMNEQEADRVRCVLAVELREMAQRMCGKRPGGGFSVLVVGLGNAEVTPDALGPMTVRELSVTRHLQPKDTLTLSALGLCEIAALAPGVSGQTGVETGEFVRGIVHALRPDLVVAVDALAARAPARLATTLQLSDTGIQPGSGIGRGTHVLDRESVGVPVMALGVPTVVDSAGLVADALRQVGYGVFSEEIRARLREGQQLFVTPKEVDMQVSCAAILLARSLEKAFLGWEES